MTTVSTEIPGPKRERMLGGDSTAANDPELERESSQSHGARRTVQPQCSRRHRAASADPGPTARRAGDGTEVRPPLYCEYGYQLRIGARTFINFGLVALDVATITIGDDVQIGPNVQLLTPTHPVEPEPRRSKLEAARPITIGDNVWLGGGVIVLPGVTIGPNSVVGAGAVVTKDLRGGVVAVGNPARNPCAPVGVGSSLDHESRPPSTGRLPFDTSWFLPRLGSGTRDGG